VQNLQSLLLKSSLNDDTGRRAHISMTILKKSIQALFISICLSCVAAADIDPSLKSMLKTAIKSGDEAQISALENIAITTWPEQSDAIKAMIKQLSTTESKQAILAATTPSNKTVDQSLKKEEDTGVLKYYLDPALWNGQLEIGGGTSTGNTEEQGISIGLSFKRIFAEKWEHDLDANFGYARSQGITTKRNIVGEYKVLWKPWEHFYTMNFLQVEADKFSGYKYRITENLGIGYEIINKDNMLWRVEGGPGVRYNKLYITDITETEFLGRISNTFEMDVWENIKVANKTSAIFTHDATTFDNKIQLSARINAHLAAKLSFSVKHDTGAPVGKKKTDTISRATIVYDF